MPVTRQRVLLCLLTIRGSSSTLPDLGIRAPTKITESFEQDMRAAVQSALYVLTTVERVVRVNSIDVAKYPGGRALTTVNYTDLTTGEDDSVTARVR